VEGVKVGSTVRVDIVQKPVFNPNWPVEPPEVTVTGVTEGMTITGPISISVEARGPNDIQLIYVAFGKMPGAGWLTSPREVFSGTYSTGTFPLDPAKYGVSGETTIEIVVYDQNDNRTHRIFHVYVEPAATPTAVAAPSYTTVPMARAVTLSKQVAFMSLEPQAAPAGANIYVELRWAKSNDDPGITGYRIYRKLAGEADFRLIYTVGRPEPQLIPIATVAQTSRWASRPRIGSPRTKVRRSPATLRRPPRLFRRGMCISWSRPMSPPAFP
jgi:hypothetical protein